MNFGGFFKEWFHFPLCFTFDFFRLYWYGQWYLNEPKTARSRNRQGTERHYP